MKKIFFTIVGLIFSCLLFAQEIPEKISYQGKLLENGSPVTGEKTITFTIDTWSETKNVQVTGGIYSVILGESNPIPESIFNNTFPIKLRVSIGGVELTPNIELISVPFAFKAQKAIEAENVFSGDYNDLINVPQNLSNFTNDIVFNSFHTGTPSTSYGTGDIVADEDLIADGDLNIGVDATIGDDLVVVDDMNVGGGVEVGTTINSAGTGDIVAADDIRVEDDLYVEDRLYAQGEVYLADKKIYVETEGTADNNSGVLYIRNNNFDERIKFGVFDGVNAGALEMWGHNQSSSVMSNVFITGGSEQGGGWISLNDDNYTTITLNGRTGVISGSSKQFRVTHPLDDSKDIVYTSIEGPEAAAYFRGTVTLSNGRALIKYPEHFSLVTNLESITVILTPLSINSKGLAVVNKGKEGVEIGELLNGLGSYDVDFEIKGIRLGYENYEVIQDKIIH